MKKSNSKLRLFLIGLIGAAAIVGLAIGGNPKNMALCTACFIRDSAGAMKMHSNAATQYFRPEIVGIVLGGFFLSLGKKEFKVTSSKTVLTQFVLGNIMMIGALVFLGCPLRLVLRMAAGDISSYIGAVGLVFGVLTGTAFVRNGYSNGTRVPTRRSNGVVLPIIMVALFLMSIFLPSLFTWSEAGPGSMFANPWLALAMGIIFGGVAYYTRLCFTGSIRDVFLMRDFTRMMPILAIFLVVLGYNIIVGDFQFQAYGPIAHDQTLWNILGLYTVGFAGVLANGCPVRQVVLAGSGSVDAGVTVLGMFFASAMAHNFGLAAAAASPENAGGPGVNGQVAIIVSIVILFVIAITGLKEQESKEVSVVQTDAISTETEFV